MKIWILPLALCLLISCTDKPLPDGILSREKMIAVLIDIHLAEAAITTQQLYGDAAGQKAADYYDMIFKKHGITKEQFKVSFEYYSQHPALYKEMYDELIIQMTEHEVELKKSIHESFIQPDTAKHRDTIPLPDTTGLRMNMNRHDSLRVHIPGRARPGR